MKKSLSRSKTIKKESRFNKKSSFAKDEGSEWNSSEDSSKPYANKHEPNDFSSSLLEKISGT